ncbi:MAG TPA: MCP four helix bundle domain-containing protein, partial [Burkholderiales bacterium]
MFKNLKVGTRLGLGFGLLVVLMLILTLISIVQLGAVNDATRTIADDRHPKVVLIDRVIKRALDNSGLVRGVALAVSEDEIGQYKQKIRENRGAMAESLTKLDQILKSEKGRELLKEVKDRDATLEAKLGFALDTSKGGKAKAGEFIRTDFAPANSAFVAALETLSRFQGDEMEKSAQDAQHVYAETRNLIGALTGVAILLALGIAFWITRGITRPLREAVSAADRLAEGDLTSKIDVHSRDETGQLLAAMKHMVGKLTQVIEGQGRLVEAANRGDFSARIELDGLQGFQREMGEGLNQLVTTTGASLDDVMRVMGAVAEGDLTKKIEQEYEGSFGQLKEYTNNTVDRLSQTIGEVRGAAQSLASASEEVSATAQSLSQAASEQAAGVEETSASVEQMTASIAQNTDNAKVT